MDEEETEVPISKNEMGTGFGIQLGNGGILFERALKLLHATTGIFISHTDQQSFNQVSINSMAT